ncbi:MAG: hypothetical protein CMJ83_12470 [Planctomycetes bacterium]|nr:hypothetical protein [Planctomycetota bacterium]
MKRVSFLLASLAIFLSACQTGSPERARVDRTEVTPGLSEIELIDIAVLAPEVATPSDVVLSTKIRATARRVLLDAKRYSVPQDAFIDTAIAEHPGATDPGRVASVTGADAALVIKLSQWDTGELIGKGRIYAGGEAVLHGKDGGVLWKRVFQDWPRIAAANVTPSNRGEVTNEMLNLTIREILDKLPAKARR